MMPKFVLLTEVEARLMMMMRSKNASVKQRVRADDRGALRPDSATSIIPASLRISATIDYSLIPIRIRSGRFPLLRSMGHRDDYRHKSDSDRFCDS